MFMRFPAVHEAWLIGAGIVAGSIGGLILWWLMGLCYRRYLGIGLGQAMLWALLATVWGFCGGTPPSENGRPLRGRGSTDEPPVWDLQQPPGYLPAVLEVPMGPPASVMLSLFVVPLGVNLWRKWIGGQVSQEEDAPGRRGFRT